MRYNGGMANQKPFKPGKSDRFRIVPFKRGKGARATAWRVTGWKRDGTRIRENFKDETAAQCRKVALLNEWLLARTETTARATQLSEKQIRLAESAFARLAADDEMPLAIQYWLSHGRARNVVESPTIDEAAKAFLAWLETAETAESLRPRTRQNLKSRITVFMSGVDNIRVADFTPDMFDAFLAKRSKLAPLQPSRRSQINDRAAVSRFFSWCMDRPRRWATVNPCTAVHLDQPTAPGPAVLTILQCEALLRAAECLNGGAVAPFVAVCLFAGLRPHEAQRLDWPAVNLADGEIRLEAHQTKSGRARVVAICPVLRAWLEAHQGKPFNPTNWRKQFGAVKLRAGFSDRAKAGEPGQVPWCPDVMRHTAVSHFFRECGSYGRTAEQFGNSEAIIKADYQGRVTSEETKQFYALAPRPQ